MMNKIYNENCLETMAKMPDNFIDLTVTSPPYDGLRTYNGYSFPFEDIAKELFRITKDGGVLVWVISDGETLSNHEFNNIKPNGNNKVSMELDDKKLTELHLYCCLKGVKINNDWSVDVTHKLLYQHES